MGGPGSYLIGEEEKKALIELIDSGYLFRYGSESDLAFLAKTWHFEQELQKFLGVPHTVAVNSGTSALWIALSALGIGPGDEVIVPGYTFLASITSIIYSRAIPILAEIDESLTLDPEDVKKKITPRTKAIMLVHMLGNPGYIDEMKAIASEHNLYLIEDTAQAFGATYKGKPAGSFGDFGTYSFNIFKTITAGDGGALSTSDENLYSRAFAIHDQGHLPDRKGVEMGSRTVIGLDFRMTEMAAAVLLVQLKKFALIKQELKRRKDRFKEGIRDLKGIRFRILPDPEGELNSLLVTLLPDEKTARNIGKELGCGVIGDSGWHVYNHMEHILGKMVSDTTGCPFTCPYYTEKGGAVEYSKGMLPTTDSIINRAINIGIGVSDAGLGAGFGVTITSSDDEIDRKIETFRNAVEKYIK